MSFPLSVFLQQSVSFAAGAGAGAALLTALRLCSIRTAVLVLVLVLSFGGLFAAGTLAGLDLAGCGLFSPRPCAGAGPR